MVRLIVVIFVLIAGVLGFIAGVSTVNVSTVDAPHGWLEYWVFRYQTLIASAFAIAALVLGWAQLRAERRREVRQLEVHYERELQATVSVQIYAEEALRGLGEPYVEGATTVGLNLMTTVDVDALNPLVARSLVSFQQLLKSFNEAPVATRREMTSHLEVASKLLWQSAFHRLGEVRNTIYN